MSCKRVRLLRIVALCVTCLTFALCAPFAHVALADDMPAEVTRAQWIHEIVETFDVTVEDENYPEEYFSDVNTTAPYYEDLVKAVEFGIIDVPLGGNVDPNGAATREFAAHTLNFCLGYKLPENKAYTFSDVAMCEHAADDQIAIDRGWFDLVGGKFEPGRPVASSEFDVAFADAREVWHSTDIDENHQNVVEFEPGVKVIPEGTAIEEPANGTFVVSDCPVSLSVGDTFAAYFMGIPNTYKVKSVSTDGAKTTIVTESVAAYEAIDYQSVTKLDMTSFQAGDIENRNSGGLETQATAEKPEIKLSIDEDSITASGSISIKDGNSKLSSSVDAKISDLDLETNCTDSTASIVLTGDLALTAKASGEYTLEDTLASARIAGIGVIKLDLSETFSGEAYATYVSRFRTGIQVMDGDVRLVKEFKKKSFTAFAKAQVKAELKLSAGIDVLVAKADIYAKAGAAIDATVAARAGERPETCVSLDGYVFAAVGAEAEVNLIVYKQSFDASYNIWDKDNSPVRAAYHYEDGVLVDHCTRDGHSSDYVTPRNSKTAVKYSGGGPIPQLNLPLTTGVDYTWDAAMTLTSDTTVLGNLIVKSAVNLNGHRLLVAGNTIVQSGGLNFTNGGMCVTQGDLKVSGGELKLSGGTMSVGGRVYQPGGTVDVGAGTLSVAGGYHMRYESASSSGAVTYSDSNGRLYMGDASGLLDVGGDLHAYIHSSSTYYGLSMSAGTLRVGGDLLQEGGDSYNCLGATGSHRTVLAGARAHAVRMAAPGSRLAALEVEPGGSVSSWRGYLNVASAGSDLTIPTDSLTFAGFNANGHNVTFTGDLNILSGALATKQGTITIEGDLNQGGGTVDVAAGKVLVLGDYRLQKVTTNVAGESTYAESSGYLKMLFPQDEVHVDGDFYFQSSTLHAKSYLNDGTLYVSGSFYDLSSNKFRPTGEHLTVLDGKGFRNVQFPSETDKFNKLKLMQNMQFYVLSHDPCWYELVDADYVDPRFLPQVTAVAVSPATAVLAPGDELQYTSWVFGVNDYSDDVVWTVSGPSCPDTTITQDGLLTIGADEAAPTIFVRATSVTDESKYREVQVQVVPIDISLAVTRVTVYAGDTYAFTATVHGSDLTSQGVTWSVEGAQSEGTVIDSDGVLKVDANEKAETVVVKAASVADPSKIASVEVTIKVPTIPVTGVELDHETLSLSKDGEPVRLTARVLPTNATEVGVRWSSSNEAVATVADDGTVVAVGDGETVITATTLDGGFEATCKVVVSTPIPVTGVSLNPATATLTSWDKTLELVANVKPSDATNKEVEWASNNPEVATVDENGIVTAVGNGIASISVTTADGGFTASCNVTVDVPPVVATGVSLDKESVIFDEVGQFLRLNATVEPDDADDKSVVWFSSNEQVATVDAEGTVTAVANGTAVITVATADGQHAAICVVDVDVPQPVVNVTGVTLTPSQLVLHTVGETSPLFATVEPADATDRTIAWSSSNETVATVTDAGVVSAVGEGDATITAKTTDGGLEVTCAVTVSVAQTSVPVESVELDQTEVMLGRAGEQATLRATVKPEDATNKSLTWSSSDESVATVSQAGVVTAVGAGTAKVTATSVDGGFSATCSVVVGEDAKVPVTEVRLNQESLTLTEKDAETRLVATVLPDNATDKTVKWVSSNESVATVAQDGTVRAIANGSAVIVVTTAEGSNVAVCMVQVAVSAEDISGATVSVSAEGLVYSGSPIEPAVSVSHGGHELVKGQDYDVAYEGNVDAGTATVIVTGKGDYTGTAKATFEIAPKSVSIPKGSSLTYTGAAQQGIAEGDDFTVEGGTATEAGDHTATIKLSDPKNTMWADSTVKDKSVVWTIAPAVITSATGAAKKYDGKAKTTEWMVKAGEIEVPADSYEVNSYESNVNAGTAKAAIVGKGNFTGRVVGEFTIEKAASSISLADQTLTHNGRAQAYSGKVTKSGSAGDVTYAYYSDAACSKVVAASNVKDAGTYYVRATLAADANHDAATSAAAKLIIVRVFSDVAANAWYAGVVYRAVGLGLLSGYSGDKAGQFGPNDNITRGQVAVVLWNMAKKPAAGAGAKTFPDVKDKDYFYNAVRWASSVGVVSGYADGRFGPNDNVTREQLAAMLASYYKNVAKKSASGSAADYASMSDRGSVSAWAAPAVGWCFRSKILSGSNGKINPQGNATRAEAAKMVVGLYDLVG